MSKVYQVTVNGTGQLNGPKRIHKVLQVDEETAKLFGGAGRYDTFSDFVKQHYPGVKFNPKDISANVVYLGTEAELEKKKQKKESKSSSKPAKKTKSSAKGTVAGAVVGAIANEMKETDEDKAERLKQEKYIDDLGKSVSEKISQIERLKVPNEKDGIVDMLDDLIYKLKSNKWKPIIGAKNEDEAKLINSLMGAYFLKYSMGLQKLERMNLPDDVLIPYQLELKKLKKRRFLGKFSYILLVLGIAAVVAILYQFGVFKD